ncbi:hypothetical protein RclHR1_00060018 [Rhizophagus clarus]|uniref:Uncharacterized protein n=1 Tax=Rhizophagus clarus TaxID=94130 RepID=A0A2Z6S2D8_9GLOM|nr:hypothetical protein RclHR1_00060018 [Rhizophagus clarus]
MLYCKKIQEKKEEKNKEEALKIFNRQEKERNELLLESQKIATNDIKDLFKIAAVVIKSTDPAEIKKCMLSLSHIATTVKETAAAAIIQDQPVQNQSTSQHGIY